MATKKTISRLIAAQALYQYEINNRIDRVEDICDTLIAYYMSSESIEDLELTDGSQILKFNHPYLIQLVITTVNHIQDIDQEIAQALSAQKETQAMGYLLAALVRVAVCELKYFDYVPYKVVVSEYTDISTTMLKSQDTAFVNFLLDRIAKSINQI